MCVCMYVTLTVQLVYVCVENVYVCLLVCTSMYVAVNLSSSIVWQDRVRISGAFHWN